MLTNQKQLDHILYRLEKESPEHIYTVLAEIGRNSLFIFARNILGYSQMTLRTHGEICDALQSESKRKLIVVPRSSFKSSICSIAYPLWLLVNNPDLRILIASELYKNSKNFLREIKQHIESERFRLIYGDLKGEPWSESEINLSSKRRVIKESNITVAGLGTQKTGMHFDVCLADDLNSENNTRNPDQAEKVIEWYRYAHSLLEPDGTVVVVGTRYAESDLIQFVLSNEIGIEANDVAY